MNNVSARARVRILVEVPASVWGGDCKLEQLYTQAAESALQTLSNALKNSQITIIDTPRVIGVITQEQ